MKQETVPQKVPNVVLFLTKSFEAKEKKDKLSLLICFPRNISFKK